MERPSSPASTPPASDHEPVPRLPRGSGFQLSGQAIIRIVMFAVLLVGVILLREPCASSVATFMGQFDIDAGVRGDAGTPTAPPGHTGGQPGDQGGDQAGALPPGNYVRITGDMSEQELEQALRQAGMTLTDASVSDAVPVDAVGADPDRTR